MLMFGKMQRGEWEANGRWSNGEEEAREEEAREGEGKVLRRMALTFLSPDLSCPYSPRTHPGVSTVNLSV